MLLFGSHTMENIELLVKDAELKRTWYSPVADIYYEARPDYPQELIDLAIALTNLDSESKILEIGCGAGNATIPFARTNATITCIEHNREFCFQAQQNSKLFPKVEICYSSFAEWQLEENKYDVVLSANAFYQLPQQESYAKAAAALKDNGFIILLWNLTPELKYEIYQSVEGIFQTYVPSLVRYEGKDIQASILEGFAQSIRNSGYFKDPVIRQLDCQITYSIEQYISLLRTLRRIDSEVQKLFFTELREGLQHWGNKVELSFLSAVHLAQKRN